MGLPRYGPDNPDITYVRHRYEEHLIDLGEVRLNYACSGDPSLPALLLIPGQIESWWGYQAAMRLLDQQFQVFAVDLRGQGRSSRTPGRYTWDNLGNDLVRFIAFRIRRPTVVAGHSSGGVLSAWLSAYAPPGMLRGVCCEDPPLFASELVPECGIGIHQTLGPLFALGNAYLGDQWSIGDWEGFLAAGGAADLSPMARSGMHALAAAGAKPPQNIKEYDPEWGRAFATGTISAGCDHGRMLRQVRCPVLFTHHAWEVDETTGNLNGAISGQQAWRVQELVAATGQPIAYRTFPERPHTMHRADPVLYAEVLLEWASELPSEDEVRKQGVFARD
jgi:pimeloyl-ACP methyl ester carboxylesterase